MYFKRLDIHGFKSFAEPVSLEFIDGMTCIVGPNGSGKSNIADAIKWVLGEQSPKTLRGGKMEEVIFAGTESRKARGIAEVTLVIDNKDGILPVEFNEVAITRKMYRSGESEYLINGSPCRLKDIRELIMDTGMGVEGYSMIGQGKISDIVNNRAEGRRELFEAAAGIVKYRSRKSEAEKKLLNSTGNLDRVNDIISEIESRIDGLKEDSIKAQEYLELSGKYKNIEINLAVRQAENIEERMNALETELSAVSGEIERYSTEKSENDSELAGIKAQIAELDLVLESIRNRLMEELERINSLRKNIEVSEEKLASADREIRRMDEELLKERLRMYEESAVLESMEEKSGKLRDKEILLKKEAEEKNAEYIKAADAAARKLEEIEKKKSDVFQLHSGINIGKTEILGLKSLMEGLLKRKQKISFDLENSDAELSEFGIKEKELSDRLSALIEEKTQSREKYSQLQSLIDENSRKEKEALMKKEETENRLHKSETKRDLLLGFENSYEGYGYAVKFIMGNRSRLRGIYGAAADLIDVPEGFETAVQTALGAGMQNIICEDDASASECIKLLKKEKAGRATFLPVKSMRGGRNAASGKDNELIRAEEGFLGFAVETVKYDLKFKSVMEYLLGRTVIADTLENAVRLSKKYSYGIRFVTLEGDDINPSGAITGGKVRNSGPNLFERKNEIKALGVKISGLSSEKEKLEKICGSLASERKKLSDDSERCSEYIKRLEADEAEIKNSLDITASRRRGVSDNAARWRNEAEDIDKELSDTEKMIDDIQKGIDMRLSEIEESEGFMDEEIKAYESEKENADRMLAEINSMKISISGLEADIRHNEENIKRSTAEIRRITEEISGREKNKKELEELKRITGESIEKDRISLKAAKAGYDEKNSESDRIKTDRQNACEKQQEIEAANIGLDRLTEEARARRHDGELKLAKSESQLEALKNRLWDSFDVTFPEAQAMRSENFAAGAASRESKEIKARMQELEPVNIGAIEEYRQVSERYRFMSEQKEDLTAAIVSLKDIISDMDRKINSRFMKSFDEISQEFRRTFTELFGGGKAELKLENSENVLESTIEIIAQPPGKKLQNISLLSGGEKSLTAIALLCSILKVRPTPFCILDEVEAALDDLNIGRFVDYIKNFENVQFIVVTHQKATMEKADVMYGITMPEKGVSKVISLKLNSRNN